MILCNYVLWGEYLGRHHASGREDAVVLKYCYTNILLYYYTNILIY
jgi:hypothetical protein